MPSSRLSKLSLLALPALLLTGCPDPDGTYGEFVARRESDFERVIVDAAPQPDANGTDGREMLAASSGEYLFALATALDPSSPLLFRTVVAIDDTVEPATITLSLMPLRSWCEGAICDAADPTRREELPPIIEAPTVPIGADFTWQADLGTVNAPGGSNPISGSDIVAQLVLYGQIRGVGDICGAFDGALSQPFEFALTRETNNFGLVPLEAGADLNAITELGRCL